MKLCELLKGLQGAELHGDGDVEISTIESQASRVTKGALFVARKGMKFDGHDFIPEAIERGAQAIVTECALEHQASIPFVVVPDTRHAAAAIAATFYGDPSLKLTLIGVTGTNGKTSVCHLLESIFTASGKKSGRMGTLGHHIAGKNEVATHTTPDIFEVERLLRAMVDQGCTACVMEVSSHALMQGRVAGLHFDGAILTNVTPDHLDYHGDMESYYQAKAQLFSERLRESQKPKRFAVLNADDPYSDRLAGRLPVKTWRYGERQGEVTARVIETGSEGTKVVAQTPQGELTLRSRLMGRFQGTNILAAVTTSLALGIPSEAIVQGVANVTNVRGRFEPVHNRKGILVFVDYAHTPDALRRVLEEGRHLTEGKVIAVFGCGGDRDREKRPLMGAIAGELADVVIVTSDNPRSESPETIIEAIVTGVKKHMGPLGKTTHGYEVIDDRRQALERAIAVAEPRDVIIAAGKGHEDYQIIGTTRHHFDDREELERILGEKCA